jgi:hypothetical protein
MAKLRDAGLTEPVKFENVKQPILDTKAELIGVLASKAKALEEAAKVDPQLQKPETQKLVQEVKAIKEIHQSLGITNAGEIPEGKTIDLKAKKPTIWNEAHKGGAEPSTEVQFTATNNIKEIQKDIVTKKQELVKDAQEQPSKGARRDRIKERAEALKKEERLKEIDELSHYEDTPDPLTVDTNKTVQNAFYKESETSAKAVTLQDISTIGKQKNLE